jgi:hypothetical protein
MKMYSLYTALGIYDLTDHSSLVEWSKERGMVFAVPKEGNVITYVLVE